MVEFSYMASEGIFYMSSMGDVSVHEIINCIDTFGNDEALPRKLLVLEDARHANALFTDKELFMINEKIEEVSKNFIFIKHAVVHSSPINTAFTVLVDSEVKSTNYFLCVFVDKTSALRWLMQNEPSAES